MTSVTQKNDQTTSASNNNTLDQAPNSERTPVINTQRIPNPQECEENLGHLDMRSQNELRDETIGLETTLKLLPSSFGADKQEELEIFLEKCELAFMSTYNLQGLLKTSSGSSSSTDRKSPSGRQVQDYKN